MYFILDVSLLFKSFTDSLKSTLNYVSIQWICSSITVITISANTINNTNNKLPIPNSMCYLKIDFIILLPKYVRIKDGRVFENHISKYLVLS